MVQESYALLVALFHVGTLNFSNSAKNVVWPKPDWLSQLLHLWWSWSLVKF